MNLTPEERAIVFKEELEKEQMKAQQLIQDKLATLSKEDREKIYRDELNKRTIYLDKTHAIKPNLNSKVFAGIIGLIASYFGFISGSILLFIVILVVGYFGGVLLLENFSSLTIFYKIHYSCTFCGQQMTYNTRESDEKHLNQNQAYDHNCPKCGEQLYINYTHDSQQRI
ncbi:hypothetical protein ACFSO0_02460 [Brevibacillus sp. GCM10020057]|uniref:hypothetical protein n=1 Tax=Brevibacillus sp. GCM10020057 TaxID=3317327 RepID=UPI00362763AB